jgi:hypothetical protein
VSDLVGLDGPWAVPGSNEPFSFIQTDLSQPFTLPRTFDLALSLEVAEHLPPAAAQDFVQSLAALAPVVAFSAAVPHQGGVEHQNEQWQDYWAGLFVARNFDVFDCIRPLVWNDPTVEWWYVQNTLLYVNHAALTRHPRLLARFAAADPGRVSVVHPRAYLRKIAALDDARVNPDPDRLPASTLARLGPRVLGRAMLRTMKRLSRTS